MGEPGDPDADVYRPDGTLLLAYRRAAVPTGSLLFAYDALRRGARHTERRTTAAGGATVFRSGTLGYLDGRLTHSTRADPRGWWTIRPLLGEMDRLFAATAPDQHAVLRAAAEQASGCRIGRTAFTTVTANRTARMAVHRDGGNLPGGYSALSVAWAGRPAGGGHLVFPRWRVAVRLGTGDLLIADTNTEPHGNTPFAGPVATDGRPAFDRVSVVAYVHGGNMSPG